MKTWRNIVIIVSAMLFGLWFGFQINRYQEIKVNMEIAELLIDKERNYFMECYKHIENLDYDPQLGSSTVYNICNGVLTVEEQDIKYRFEADNMTIRFWVEGYIELPWFFKLDKKYKKVYEKYQIYELEYRNLMEKL